MQIATKFLFSVGWRTKKALRGSALDWTDLIIHCLRWSKKARYYLAEEVLFKRPTRFQEYLIDCTSAEVRHSSVNRICSNEIVRRFEMHLERCW